MLPLNAARILFVEGVEDDRQMRARMARLLTGIASDEVRTVGYEMFHWRPSGCEEHRRRTGLVCQPAWQLHTIQGCHFRCAYCNLGWLANIMMNLEQFVARLDGWLDQCPGQTLFQYDNVTDTVCFEPEYGGAKLLIGYFARRDAQALVFSELARVSPATPYAFCREKRDVWEHFADELGRHDQHPDDYLWNCGPFSAPATAGARADRRA